MKYNKLVQGVGDNDYDGLTTINGKPQKFYTTWLGMLMRCYNETVHINQPRYSGCSVCDEWKSLTKFKEWFDVNYKDGYSLDKDLLVKGNKIYSPDTCIFLPIEINNFITEATAIRGEYMIGVKRIILKPTLRKPSKPRIRYVAQLNKTTKWVSKTFDTEIEAHLYWKSHKHHCAIELINKYTDLSDSTKRALSTRYSGDSIYIPL